MSKVQGPPRSGPPRAGGDAGASGKASRSPRGAQKVSPGADAEGAGDAEQGDKFERRQALSAAVGRGGSVAAGRRPSAARFVFTDQDIEYLNGFMAALAEEPRANRKRRAALLVAAILRKKSLARLLQGLSEPEREAMGEAIADALDTSPRYAQLVDVVSEGVSK